MAYMDHAVFVDESGAIELGKERPAIRHMQTAVQGSPVIIEGLTDLYRWGNRFAVYTGCRRSSDGTGTNANNASDMPMP